MPTKSSKVNSADAPKWKYQCIYCHETFFSGRALGGHQNIHRFERRENKRTHHLRVPIRDQTGDGSSTIHFSLIPTHLNVQPTISPPNRWATGGHWPAVRLCHGSRFPPAPPPLSSHDEHMQYAINVAQDHPWKARIGQAAGTHALDISLGATAVEDAVEITSKMRVDLEVDLELKL